MRTARGKFPKMALGAIIGIAAAFALAACSQRAMLEKISTPEDRTIATQVIADLQRGPAGDADLASRFDPTARAQLLQLLPQIRGLLPAGPGAEAKLVDASRTLLDKNGVRQSSSYLAYDIWSGERHALLRIAIVRQNGSAVLDTLYVNPLRGPAEKINAFTLVGKSPAQYLTLILIVLSFTTIVVAEIALLRTPGIPRKWLWFLGCLFGYGRVSVDWATGALGVAPLYLQLLGAFAIKPGVLAPWQVGFGLPIVAVIFLLTRRRLQRVTGDGAPGRRRKKTDLQNVF